MAATKAKRARFPKLIHVTRERSVDGSTWLAVQEDGVFGVDDPKPMAIYMRVRVGRVAIAKRFVGNGKAGR